MFASQSHKRTRSSKYFRIPMRKQGLLVPSTPCREGKSVEETSIVRPVSPPSLKRSLDHSLFEIRSTLGETDIDRAFFCPPPFNSKRRRRVSTSSRSSKSVRFLPNAIVHIRHFSDEDLANAWYAPMDCLNFRKECKQTVAAIANVQGDLTCLDARHYCTLGLEEYIAACLCRRAPCKRDVVRYVVMTHTWQRKRGAEDQHTLKHKYVALSKKYQKRALERASSMEKAIY